VLARHAGIDEATGQLAADGDGPRQLVISSDFYSVYASAGKKADGPVNLYCRAHVRRHFVRAGDANPAQLGYWTQAWLDRIKNLYAAHQQLMAAWNQAAAATPREAAAARLEEARGARDAATGAIDEASKKQMAAPGLQESAKKALATLDREWDGPIAHRESTEPAWTLGTVTTILSNPRYTGRQVWNRQRTDKDLAGPADVTLGHKSVQRWNLPDGWVISARPAHPALVSEDDFIVAQDVNAARGPAPSEDPAVPERRRYLLAGLLACGTCGRRMESAWSNGKPACRCRHGHTSAASPDPGRPKNAYVREDRIVPRLPLHLLWTSPVPRARRRTRRGADVRPIVSPEEVIGYRREHQVTLAWDRPPEPCTHAPPEPPRPSP
jgi:hypothetical protein